MTFRFLIFAAAAIIAGRCAHAASLLDWIFPKHDVQVIAVTDTTPAGLLRRPASPDNPIYYVAVSAGYRDFGGIVAGEKVPKKEQVFAAIAKVLAKQGYLPATNEHPATILMLWTWGTMNTDRFYTGNPDDLEGRQVNRQQLLRFMGGYKVGLVSKEPSAIQDSFLLPGALFRDADSELISELASEDLYVAALAAYDAAAAARKEKVLLWTTKISCPSRGLAMNETLPAMLTLAGPYIGRETAKPVSVKATEKFKPEVKIGDPTTIEFLEKNAVQVIEAPATDPKKTKQPAPKKR
ncbi:MAG: hypothetical protein JNL39_19810 [Opitutaceae bacterium]|nr:hypothetical protein [Opitutaceae bacterium]